MAHPLQGHFLDFHNKIKLDRFDENSILREKRDIVINKLRDKIKSAWEDKDDSAPTFETKNQGSYEMGTGIVPLDGDYDIDVAVIFEVAAEDYPNPVEVKKWVLEALNGHTKDVKMKRPCVTVQYQNASEPVYHVDLPIYSSGEFNADKKTRIAMGKLHSSSEEREWQTSDPVALCDEVANRFHGDDAAQFRRVIRYMKRWKDTKFPSSGNSAPTGIGLTMAAYHWFQPSIEDSFSGKNDRVDLTALRNLVSQMLTSFTVTYNANGTAERLVANLPVEPFDDPFRRMTDEQMKTFKNKLQQLFDALDAADQEADPVEACKQLAKVFGDDFPIPEKSDTGKKSKVAVLSSSSSA